MPRKKPSPEEDLITPIQAIACISHYAGGDYLAKMTIADGLHSGRLTAYADEVWEREGVDPQEEWADLKHAATLLLADCEIEPSYWRGSAIWPEEMRYWHWDEANFVLCIDDEDDVERPWRNYIRGIKFSRAEMLLLIGRTDRSGVGGRKSDRKRWADFWVGVLYKFTHGLFDWTQFDSRHALKQALQSASGDEFSDNNIDFVVDLIWDRIVERVAAENRAAAADKTAGE